MDKKTFDCNNKANCKPYHTENKMQSQNNLHNIRTSSDATLAHTQLQKTEQLKKCDVTRSMMERQCKYFASSGECDKGKTCKYFHLTLDQMISWKDKYVSLSKTKYGKMLLNDLCGNYELPCGCSNDCLKLHITINQAFMINRNRRNLSKKPNHYESLLEKEDKRILLKRQEMHDHQEMIDSKFDYVWRMIFELLRESILELTLPVCLIRIVADYFGSDKTYKNINNNIYFNEDQSNDYGFECRKDFLGTAKFDTCFACMIQCDTDMLYVVYTSCVPNNVDPDNYIKAKIICRNCFPCVLNQDDYFGRIDIDPNNIQYEFKDGKIIPLNDSAKIAFLGLNNRWKFTLLSNLSARFVILEGDSIIYRDRNLYISIYDNNYGFNIINDNYINWLDDYNKFLANQS